MANSINFTVELDFDADFDIVKYQELVEFICKQFDIDNARINITITGDNEMHRTNKQFLKHDFTTDVISFDLSDEFEQTKNFDIIVNAQMAQRQSKNRQHGPTEELALYITHGMLHNMGFDDLTEAEAEKIHKAEDDILQTLGFGVVYDS